MRVVSEFLHLFFRIWDRSRLPNLHQGDRWPISCRQRRQPSSGRSSAEVEQPLNRRALTQGKPRNRKKKCWVILSFSLRCWFISFLSAFVRSWKARSGASEVSLTSSLYSLYFLYTCFPVQAFLVFKYLLSSSLLIIVRRIFIQQLLVIIKHSQLSVLEPIGCLSAPSWYKMCKILYLLPVPENIFFSLCAVDPALVQLILSIPNILKFLRKDK